LTAENAAKLLSNPVVAKSVYLKIEKDYGIPAEQAEAWAKKHGNNIEAWAELLEEQ